MASSSQLPGPAIRRLQEALLSAFPTRSALAQMVRVGLEANLEAIAAQENLSVAAFELIRWAEAQGRLEELLAAARRENPGNPVLCAFAEELGKQERDLLAPSPAQTSGTQPSLPVRAVAIVVAIMTVGVLGAALWQKKTPAVDPADAGSWVITTASATASATIANPPPTVMTGIPLQGPPNEQQLRKQLEPRVWSGKGSIGDINMLKAICSHLDDQPCRQRAAEMLRKKQEEAP